MNRKNKRISVFFAIPCGDFFSVQNQCIKALCKKAAINPIIIEDHTNSAGLWERITRTIDSADYFVADISSKSPNVILELGYAIREKKSKYIAVFIADNVPVPVDLQGFTLQKYTSIRDFQNKLIKWIVDNIPFVNATRLNGLNTRELEFYDDFKDFDRFLKLWSFPPESSFQLTHEGLRFSNAHFPIMTTHLALLRNYEFEFKARIVSQYLGWIVKGTRRFEKYLPEFCVMFNINENGELRPHIFNSNMVVIDPPIHYHGFDMKKVKLRFSKESWFTLVTRIIDDTITVFNDDEMIFNENFNEDPYREVYQFPNKQGEVGFRCYPGEQGIINYMRVRELDPL